VRLPELRGLPEDAGRAVATTFWCAASEIGVVTVVLSLVLCVVFAD
jgi:hypothetical protein